MVAITLHFAWNFSTLLEIRRSAWYGVALLLMVPSAIALTQLVRVSLEREGNCLRQYLSHYLVPLELQAVSSIGGRIGYSLKALFRQGLRDWKRSKDFLQAASQLAFLRRDRNERGVPASDQEEEELRARLLSLKSQLNRRFARPE